ncbi:MAG: restriction endonuclease subunit S [Bacteroidales bacterium]|nr:restriction endonuclease subunit S [Bacteroidales bacterium]
MFGSLEKTKPLSECIGITFPGEWGEDDSDGSGVNVIRTTNFTNSGKLDLTNVVTRKIDQVKIDKKHLIPGDIILERSGGTAENPVGRVVYFEAIGTFLFNNFTQLLRCKDGVNSLFVFYSLYNYYHTHKSEIRSMGNKTTGIQNLKMDKYWDIPIADASPELQDQFVCLYKQADKSKFSDFKSRFIEMFGNPLSAEQKYPLKRLADCVDINPRRPQLSLSDTDQVSFVPMPCVSEEGYLQNVESVDYGTVKKGFTYFEEGDVLFAKITPCMENGKGAIAEDLINGIGMGSTEYHVLREKPEVSNKYWILAFTRLPIFREDAAKNMTGTGGQKRVGESYLSDFRIGLPPIEAQQEFEQLYRQADKSKFELKQAIEKIDKVMRALLQ